MTALSLASPIISLHICISVTLLLAVLWGEGQISGSTERDVAEISSDVSAPGVGIFVTHSQPESCPCFWWCFSGFQLSREEGDPLPSWQMETKGIYLL